MKADLAHLANIPPCIKAKTAWVGFKVAGGTKTPVVADSPNRKASSTNPKSWRAFDTAVNGLQRGDFNCIGYALNGEEIGIDLDDCIDDDKLKPYAAEIVERCGSYSEESVSGTGLHILLKGNLGKGHKSSEVELYGRERFFICTGRHLPTTPENILFNPEAVEWLVGTYMGGVTEKIETIETIEDISLPPPVHSAISVTTSIDDLIQLTLPTRPRQRNVRLFEFARGLRHNLGMRDAGFKQLKPLVRRWFEAALPNIQTKDFTTTWADFCHCWPLADHPIGVKILEVAWEKAKAEPPPAVAADYDLDGVRKLVALCAALGRLSHDGRFFLATHSAAPLLEVHPMVVHRWLRMLIADGIIELRRRGNQRQASRFRWIAKPTVKGEEASHEG